MDSVPIVPKSIIRNSTPGRNSAGLRHVLTKGDISDDHGHDAGDEVLRRLGALLAREFRGEDTACRYGGEEFLVILPYATPERCWTRAVLVKSWLNRS